MQLSRRDFLRHSSRLAASLGLSTALSGCALRERLPELGSARFTHGVASGDPTPDGMILWTRAVPAAAAESVAIGWELARDEGFARPLRSGVASASAATDFTVKIDVRELQPGTRYYYRFRDATGFSSPGVTRTLPVGQVESLRFAVFSCSNYPAGYFHAYSVASQLPDVDAFLHLGDYIYEYGAGGYATERAAELGREFPADNAGELFSLNDYRRRYALYRSDADLQAMHAAAPMIAVWDDHEIANDTWSDGAQNHGPDEGDFDARRTAAVQAYFEWLPLRPLLPDAQGRIYRGFSFGNLVDLHMLDTRLIGRDQQLAYSDYIDGDTGAMDIEALDRALADPQRSLLGQPQREWLYERLSASSARWQVLGQQILIARMHMPAEMLSNLFRNRGYASAKVVIDELTELKRTLLAGGTLSSEQRRRVQQVLPYNPDAWDGYDAERERLYDHARQAGKSLVVLSGDTHNAWYSALRDRSGIPVGIELGTAGVSSPGMESFLRLDATGAETLADALTVLIDELQYCELAHRGFLEVRFNTDSVRAIWHFIDDITRRDYAVATHQIEYGDVKIG